MSRRRVSTGLAIGLAVLAVGWSNTGVAGLGIWRPVGACEAAKPLPPVSVCHPVAKIAPPVCSPVKVCEAVKTCGPVDGHVKHVALREHVLVARHHRQHRERVIVEQSPGTTYSSGPAAAPSAAPQLPAPPAPANM